MIELRPKRDKWMTDAGFASIPWKQPHGNLTIVGAVLEIRFNNFRIRGKIYKYNTKGFRLAFQKERVWEKLSK